MVLQNGAVGSGGGAWPSGDFVVSNIPVQWGRRLRQVFDWYEQTRSLDRHVVRRVQEVSGDFLATSKFP